MQKNLDILQGEANDKRVVWQMYGAGLEGLKIDFVTV